MGSPTDWINEWGKNTSKHIGEAKTQFHHKPHPQGGDSQLRETHNPELFHEECKCLNVTLTPQLLRPATEKQAPKTSSFQGHQDLHPQYPQVYSELRNYSLKACTDLTFQSLIQRQPTEKCSFFLWKSLFCLY